MKWRSGGTWVCGLVLCCLLSFGCGQVSDPQTASSESESPAASSLTSSADLATIRKRQTGPIEVTLKTSEGEIVLRLYADKAPRTVENFVQNYVDEGRYDETIFHHVEPGRMIIGGGYSADLAPRATKIPVFNEADNGLSNRRGTIAMVREPDEPHSATCQFFINLGDNRQLDYQGQTSGEGFGYCVFGEVVKGLDIAERIAQKPTESIASFANLPTQPVVIQEVKVLR